MATRKQRPAAAERKKGRRASAPSEEREPPAAPGEEPEAATDDTPDDLDLSHTEPGDGELDGDVSADLPELDTLALTGEPDEPEEPGPVATALAPIAERSLARFDPLSRYIQEVRRYPLLSREDEHELAVRYARTGDVDAARTLITANLRLVIKIAHEYRQAHRNLLDLVQEGNIGLIQAVGKFDPYRGVKLSSYAAFWIRAYMLKFILNNWRLVKIGTTQAQRKLFFNLRKEREKLEQLGFQATSALLAEKLEVPEKEVIEMERRLAAPEASLDAPLGDSEDGGARTRMDYLPSDEQRPDHAVAQSEFSQLLRGKLEAFAQTLEGREQTIFRERWLTEDPLTLQEIGDRYNVSRERARQLEKRMLDRLKKYLEAEMGTAVDIEALTRE
jgi:RNA polymerase sigma-32 factor